MKLPIPIWYDRALDFIACCLFPPPKRLGFRILGHEVTWIDVALVLYTLAIGLGLWWFFGHWFWFPATIIGMVMAAMIWEWFF